MSLTPTWQCKHVSFNNCPIVSDFTERICLLGPESEKGFGLTPFHFYHVTCLNWC
jgi:hypothetical protein